MSTAVAAARATETQLSAGALVASLVASAVLHGALYLALAHPRPPPAKPSTPIEFEVVQRPPPPPPPPEEEKEPEPEKPKPPPKVALKPPPPPPPNVEPAQPPPPDAKPPPIKIGISLGSTTQAGGFTVGVGNTLYGKPDDKAADPNAVRPYAATETKQAPYVPPTRVTSLPQLLFEPRIDPKDYPEQARNEGIEGRVVLLLRIDEHGRVVGAKVLDGPGFGLNEAAAKFSKLWKFRPALLDGVPVVTETRLTYTFTLD